MMYRFTDICNGRCYIIPENQRGYSWAPQNASAIFSDLTLVGTQAHYMGAVIVTRTKGEDFQDDDLNTTAEFTLEDGQQRLTTFFLIANEIKKRIEDINGGPDIQSQDIERLLFYKRGGKQLRIKNSNPDLDQYFSFVLKGSPAPPFQKTPPMVAIDRVNNEIKDYFTTMTIIELISWKNKITNQAKFIWVDLQSEKVNRYLTFDAINSRGMPLSEFDKIKNFCILVANKRGIAFSPDKNWYKAITNLEKYKVSSRAEEAAYMAEMYAAFHNERIPQESIHEYFVKKYNKLLTFSDVALEKEFKSFVNYWETLSESFGFIACKSRSGYYGSKLSTKLAGAWLDRLDNMGLPGITRILLTVCQNKFIKSDFEKVVRACEVFTFRVYGIGFNRKDKHANHITNVAYEVLRNGKGLQFVLENMCRWISDLSPMPKFIKELSNGEPKYYNDRNIKGWSQCYYFLYEYEISNSPRGVSPISWEQSELGRVNTQEHILPQKHRDGGWWEAHWPDELKAERFKHRLGNLTLTSNNPVLSRKEISLKIQDPAASHYYKHANATNSEKKIPSFTTGTEWKSENILKREYDLLKFAVQRWSMPCCSDNTVIILPAEFASADKTIEKIKNYHSKCINCSDLSSDNVSEPADGEEVPVVMLITNSDVISNNDRI